MIAVTKLSGLNVLGVRFTKQGILTLDPNSIKAQMGGETSAGDLLTSCTLKNKDATFRFYNDQRNLPRALNNAANTSELTIANLSKSRCVIHLYTLLP